MARGVAVCTVCHDMVRRGLMRKLLDRYWCVACLVMEWWRIRANTKDFTEGVGDASAQD